MQFNWLRRTLNKDIPIFCVSSEILETFRIKDVDHFYFYSDSSLVASNFYNPKEKKEKERFEFLLSNLVVITFLKRI